MRQAAEKQAPRQRGASVCRRGGEAPAFWIAGFEARRLPELGLSALLLALILCSAARFLHPDSAPSAGPSRLVTSLPMPEAAGDSLAPKGISSVVRADFESPPSSVGEYGLNPSQRVLPEVPLNPGEELEQLLKTIDSGTDDTFRTTMRHWAEADPSEAAAWAAGIKEERARSEAFEQVVLAWADKDLSTAAGWAESLPEGKARETAMLALSYEEARTDPLSALRMMVGLPDSHERDEALMHAASQWAASDPVSASAWSAQINDAALRERLISAIAIAAAEAAPAAAARLAAVSLEPGSTQANAAVSIVERWAQTAPQEAAEWVSQFPDSAVQLVAMDSLASIWASRDPASLERWARDLPPGELRDAAYAAYARTMTVQGSTGVVGFHGGN